MKTRSNWGTDEDWISIAPNNKHIERMSCRQSKNYGGYYAQIEGSDAAEAKTQQEARCLAVENFCRNSYRKLPWREHLDLSTEAGCREAIQESGYSYEARCGEYTLCAFQLYLRTRQHIGKEFGNGSFDWPALCTWQEAALWSINNPAGDK